MALITSETASEMGKKGSAARWNPKPPPPANDETLDEQATRARRQRLERQLDAIDDAIDAGGLKSSDWRDLTSARERLFRQWQVLANIPNPGNLKPSARRTARPSAGPGHEPAVE